MAVITIDHPRKYMGLSTDTKPTKTTHGTVPGSTFFEYDTGTLFITYDGTNWEVKPARYPIGLLSSGIKTASAQIKGSAGDVYWISFSDTAALAFELNNSVGGGGTDLWGLDIPADGYGILIFDPPLEFSTGIYLDVSTGTCKVTIGYK